MGNILTSVVWQLSSSFVGDLKTALCTFAGNDDDESVDVSILVENADFDSMPDNGWQTFDDLQRANDVVVSGDYEVYPLTGETDNHAIGRPSAVLNLVSLLHVLLSGKAVSVTEHVVVVSVNGTNR